MLHGMARHRLVLAVLAPVLTLMVFSGYVVQEKLETYRQSSHMLQVAELARAAHVLIRGIENERSTTALYISTGRTSWRPEMIDRRLATDQKIEEFRHMLTSPSIRPIFDSADVVTHLADIDRARREVENSGDLMQVVEAYGEAIKPLSAISNQAAHDSITNLVAAYTDLGRVKDQLARARSIGVFWLLGGKRKSELLSLFIEAHAEKKALLQSFEGHVASTPLSDLHHLLDNPKLLAVHELHRRAIAGKLTPADADTWQQSHMALADLITEIEDRLAGEMEAEIRAKLMEAKRTFYIILLAVIGLVGFSLETLRRSEKRAAVAQDEARTLLRAMEQSPVSVMVTDPGGRIEYVNPAFSALTRFDRAEVIGETPRILRSDKTPAMTYTGMWHAISAGQDWRGELVNRRKDGSEYWEQITISPVKNSHGAITNYVAFKEDVTELRTLRLALEREHENLRRILDATHDGIALVDASGQFLYANPALTQSFGPIAGRSCRQYFDDLGAECPFCDLSADGEGFAHREWPVPSTGRTFELTSTAVGMAEGGASHLLVFHDITLRKDAEAAMDGAREAAELANRAKTEFLATMSHELRTPLNAIIGFSEIIENQLLGEIGQKQYLEYAEDIHQSGLHLLQLINDILDVARIEVGRVTLRETDVAPAATLAASLQMVRDRAEEKGVTLNLSLPSNLPYLWADERRLKQILVNLIGNAIKFTDSGGSVTVSAISAQDGGLDITIADTGIGIRAEDISKVLAPFGQADSSLARRFQGSGLGLPLSRQLMELHGGTLDIDSQLGGGTTVTIHFPQGRVRVAA